jgi:hypothetical protein
VLADGEAEDGGRGGEGEAVAVLGGCGVSVLLFLKCGVSRDRGKATYMATLCEMMVFSLSSNSWKVSGLRTALGTA